LEVEVEVEVEVGEDSSAVNGVETMAVLFFFFVLSYSHVAYLDYGGVLFKPFPRRCPRDGGVLEEMEAGLGQSRRYMKPETSQIMIA
jgi:hypothetical protein